MAGTIKKALAIAALSLSTFLSSQAGDLKVGIEPSVGYSSCKIKLPESARNVSVTGNVGYWDLPIIRSYDMTLPSSASYNTFDGGLALFVALDSSEAWKNFRIGRRFSYDCRDMIGDSALVASAGGNSSWPDAAVEFDVNNENIFMLQKDLCIWKDKDWKGREEDEGWKLAFVGEMNKHDYKLNACTYRIPYGDEWYMPLDTVKTSSKEVGKGTAYSTEVGLRWGSWFPGGEGFIEGLVGLPSKDVESSWAVRLGGTIKF
jgi:hypothetical protein